MAKRQEATFILGIDLGTTNCALSYVDLREVSADAPPVIRPFPVPQLTGPGRIEERPTLPSFLYLPPEAELEEGQANLPWVEGREHVVGHYARRRGEELPGRYVHSAKSWLCHDKVDRTAPILPFEAEDGVRRWSPVGVSAAYLTHLREAWDAVMARGNEALAFDRQEVLITVPASFDAAAKDLTLRAAEEAGISRPTLLEEPQAAFYSWLYHHPDDWRRQVKKGDVVLVCDVGGGTTDFSLIAVTEEGGDLQLNRIAVGEHILLGGDNMDMAIAARVRQTLKEQGRELDKWQFRALCNLCREAKEQLLPAESHAEYPLTILGKGRSVVGGSFKTTVDSATIGEIVLEGFFPRVEVTDFPQKRPKAGLTELGLKYSPEPAVTRHLARFLTIHTENEAYQALGLGGDFVRPTAVLFNGGVMKAPALQARVAGTLAAWMGREAKVLENADLDLAVSVGAAYYGLVRRGSGIRIRGGLARSYFVGLESSMPAVPGMEPPLKAVCLAPAKTEEGTALRLEGREFGLAVGEEAVFRFFSSSTLKNAAVGAVLEEFGEELEELPPLETTLPAEGDEAGGVIPVELETYVSETGTIEVYCVSKRDGRKFKLEFSVRENRD